MGRHNDRDPDPKKSIKELKDLALLSDGPYTNMVEGMAGCVGTK